MDGRVHTNYIQKQKDKKTKAKKTNRISHQPKKNRSRASANMNVIKIETELCAYLHAVYNFFPFFYSDDIFFHCNTIHVGECEHINILWM